jgi:probable phosphoglycerate mutase
LVIYLLRHGETKFNIEGRHQGWNDSALTEKGILHAHHLAEMLEGRDITCIFSSDLGRALKTATIIGDKIRCHISLNPEIREITWGILDGTTSEERKAKFADLLEARKKDKVNFRFSEGESYNDLANRVQPLIKSSKDKFPNQNIAMVGHEAVNRIILMLFLDSTFEEVFKTEQPNNIVYQIRLPEKEISHTKDYGESWLKGLHYRQKPSK